MYRLQFDTKFPILLIFIESLKFFLVKKVTTLMMSAKMAAPGFLKLKIMTS